MTNFFTTSIGRKILMSVTGLFLIMFLLVHLTVNSMILFDGTGDLFNRAAHFMATNPLIRVVEPLLAIGLVAHFLIASFITFQNQRNRNVNYGAFGRYKTRNASAGSAWPSRNMYILGTVILVFLVIHLINFFWKMKFTGDPLLTEVTINGEHMENAYALVTGLFINWKWSVALYVVGAIALGLHLYHGVWSAFQTLGCSNKKWRKIWNVIGVLFSLLLALGYSIIPLYVMIRSMI
ncbi:MAG: succinate dehydrogenase cytochrome b subunit [Bacteroidota bacterium]|nr:succinate dehydrogenase cytochrome b subunit [Bacteroidota bacterium]